MVGYMGIDRELARPRAREGFVLLVVIAFIALMLPLIVVVLATISTETVSVAEAIKGSRAEAAAEQATAEAISIVLQEKQLPDYWTSVTQANNAVMVDDGFGVRRDNIANNGAGPDGVYGTEDDYWIGPRKDRSFLPGDDPDDPRNYDYDFRYLSLDSPVYLAQRWAFSLGHSSFYYVPTPQAVGGAPIELYSQFAAVQSDQDGDGMNEGFIPDALDMLLLPGYYPSGMPPPGTPINLDLTSGTIAQDSLAFRVRTYEGLFESLDQGPVPSTLTRSYGSVTDEAGRLNLNIFCKKVRVWAPESASYDSTWWSRQMTSDFNNNGIQGEDGWHWIDNPLFPDRDTTQIYAGTFDVNGAPVPTGDIIDFGGYDPFVGLPNPNPDGRATIWLGETVQHLYTPDWVHSAVKSKLMLMALPGITESIAENILMTLNPDLSAFADQDAPSESGGTPAADDLRLDAANITPALTTFNALFGGPGGQITSFYWDYEASLEDDLPLPPPRPFTDVKELLNVQGMTPAKFDRVQDLVTVHSYDTNVIGNYISDVSSTVDPVNPPELPPGAARRQIPGYLVDRDTVPDLRYDLNMPLYDTSMSALREQADVLFNFVMNHLPEGVFNKFTLPVVDRAGRTPSLHGMAMDWYRNTSWEGLGYPYNVGEAGHEEDFLNAGDPGYELGCDYPALDPPFSRDSALSILLYRYGMYDEDAYHHYAPTADYPRVAHPGIPIPGTRSFIPIFDPIIIIPGLLEFYFQPTYIPGAAADQNAIIPGHLFTSAADVLEVPLYKFSQFSVDMMADPPSDYICQLTGRDTVTVRYLVSLSDTLKVGEYMDNGTPLDLTDDAVAHTYDIYFDYNNDAATDNSVALTFGQDLRLVGAPPMEQRDGIITTFDQETGQRFIVFEHTFDAAEVPDPNLALAGRPDPANPDFAYDAFGNPFVVARVLGVKAAGTSQETLADQIVKVYLQENCDTEIPLKANILALRQGADTFRVISAVGGGVEEPNAFRLYNWQFAGETQGYDGTYPPQPSGIDPRVVTVTPETDTVTLTVYDLYAQGSAPCWPGLPATPPSVVLPAGIMLSGQVNPAFPAAPYPARGIDSDTAQVGLIGASPDVVAEVAVEPPVIDRNGTAAVHVGIYGGESPYDFRVRIFDGGGTEIYNYQQLGVSSSTYLIEPADALGNSLFGIAGTYTIVLTANDSQTPPSTFVDVTTLIVGTSTGAGRSFTNVPNMVVSLNVEALEATQKGFRATANVSGGRGEYGYYWEVFDENGAVVRDVDGALMQGSGASSEDLVFPATVNSDGVYLVKVMVIDQADKNPNNATNTVLATDSAMVVLATAGAPLEPQPMAVLAARPPGNDRSAVDTTAPPAPLIYGAGPQPILTSSSGTMASPGIAEVNPEVAPTGGVIELYGFNFNMADPDGLGPLPAGWYNEVHFAGSVVAHPFEVFYDPSYAGPAPARQIMRVVVPHGALTGWLHVEVNVGGDGGVSNSAFFQTQFLVTFDLVASVTPNTVRNYTYELDFQGDGIYDFRFDSSQGGGGGAVRYSAYPVLEHDYAWEGFGNYQATLRVTDVESRRVVTSRQLVQIRNLRPLMDSSTNTPEAFGLCTSVMPEYDQAYPMPGDAIDIRSFVGGITSFVGVKYKWNIDGNGRYALLSSVPPSLTYWEREPNDTWGTANPMPVDYDPYTDGYDWTGRVTDPTDDDWFSLDTPQAGTLTMLLECFSVTGTEHIDVDLYDSALMLIDSGSITAGENHAWATTDRLAPTGTYYVRVSADSPQTYELEATYAPNPGNTFWETESNDDSASADVMALDYDPDRDGFPFTGEIPPGSPNDEDWYMLRTATVGTLNVLMQSFDQLAGHEVYFSLYDASLVLLDSATIGMGDICEVVSTGTDVAPGTFFVRVWANWHNQRYNLDPSFTARGEWPGAGPVNFSVRSSINADGRYLNPGIPLNYYANLTFNFTSTDASVFDVTIDESVPVVFSWDVDGNGIIDYVAPATTVRTDLYAAHVSGAASHIFPAVGTYNGWLYVTGSILITDTGNNVSSQPFTLPQPAPLPTVDVGNVLDTLHLPALSNNTDHVIALTVGTEEYDALTTRSHRVYASDSVFIPSAERMLNDVFAYVGTQGPYSLGNTPGSVNFTLSAIYGENPVYDFFADINTDGRFEIGQTGYLNPQTGMRVSAYNGPNMLNPGLPNSFPTILPGVNFDFVNVHMPIEADKGVYNSYALVKDNPTTGLTAYSFDSQEIMVGGNRAGGGSSGLPVGADIFIDPLVGVTSQSIGLYAYAGGGDAPYSYSWQIVYASSGQNIQFANPEQADLPNPVFVATRDAADELGASVEGDYRATVTVMDATGATAASRTVTFTVVKAPLNAQLLAFPPAVGMNEGVNFLVHIDGGTPPYDVQITYNDPDVPGAVENRTTTELNVYFEHTYTSSWLDRTVPANGRYDDPEDGVNVEISVTDFEGNTVSPATSINATQKILVGERLPLNISMAVAPSAGSYNFDVQVNYTVSGGRKMSLGTFGNLAQGGGGAGSDDYFVVLTLMSASGASVWDDVLAGAGLGGTYFGSRVLQTTVRTESSTLVNPWGSDGVFMNGDAGEVYDPVFFHIPQPGNYFITAWVTDGSGEFAIDRAQVYALGFLVPGGASGAAQVRRDRDGRPLHAVRIWTDPLYRDSLDGDFRNNNYRLREADVQVFGDLLTVDPDPSIVSPGFLAAADPADATPFDINYLVNPRTPTPVDFYDTFTIGRVNINTASEEVLTSLFTKIIRWREFYRSDDPGGAYSRGERNYAGDVYLSFDEARALAKAVVEYRTAYYDAYKPSVGGAHAGFEYAHGVSADPYATGSIRADHLPVIGPWDGAIPRAYDVTSRDNALPDYDDNTVMNTWDDFRGVYYNLDRSSSPLQLYAPSDIAVVREQLAGETEEDYARYLNDTLDNRADPNADGVTGDDMGFDAREYFTYDTVNGEDRADARNRVAIIQSNGETGFTYMPNPPFRSLFDLYKVIGVSDPDLYALIAPDPRSFDVQDDESPDDPDGIFELRLDSDGFSALASGAESVRTLSGPSLFRYAEVWDDRENRFVVVANYLDDIAPYVTTRSYTFRTSGVGGVSISGESEVVPVALDRVQRDRSVTKVIDVGKLRVPAQGGGVDLAASRREPYTTVYEERGGVGGT